MLRCWNHVLEFRFMFCMHQWFLNITLGNNQMFQVPYISCPPPTHPATVLSISPFSPSHLQVIPGCKFWLPAQTGATTLWHPPQSCTESDLIKITHALWKQWHYTQWILQVHTFLDLSDHFALLKHTSLSFHGTTLFCFSYLPSLQTLFLRVAF